MHPSVTDVFKLPHLETLDVTLAEPNDWRVVYLNPSDLAHTLTTFRLRNALYIWVDFNSTWPPDLCTLDLKASDGIFIPDIPRSVVSLSLDTPHGKLDDELVLHGEFPDMKSITIGTKGAFGLPWIRGCPRLETVRIKADVVILDASIDFLTQCRQLTLQSNMYFAMARMTSTTFGRLRSIPHVELRCIGGKKVHIDELR